MTDEAELVAAEEASVECSNNRPATIVVFDRETGGVKYTATTDESTLLFKGMAAMAEGCGMMRLPEGMTEAEMHGKRVDFETMEVRDAGRFEDVIKIDGNVISGIPAGTKVMVQSSRGLVIDGVLRISARYAQRIPIMLVSDAFADWSEEIDVVPAEHIDGVTHAIVEPYATLRRGEYATDGDKWDLLIKALAKVPQLSAIPEIAALIEDSARVKSLFPKGDSADAIAP